MTIVRGSAVLRSTSETADSLSKVVLVFATIMSGEARS